MKKQVVSKSQLFGFMLLAVVAMTGIFTAKTDTSNSNVYEIVYDCGSFTHVDVSNWNTKYVTNMDSMFQDTKINHVT